MCLIWGEIIMSHTGIEALPSASEELSYSSPESSEKSSSSTLGFMNCKWFEKIVHDEHNILHRKQRRSDTFHFKYFWERIKMHTVIDVHWKVCVTADVKKKKSNPQDQATKCFPVLMCMDSLNTGVDNYIQRDKQHSGIAQQTFRSTWCWHRPFGH